jgi:uncharacterized protein
MKNTKKKIFILVSLLFIFTNPIKPYVDLNYCSNRLKINTLVGNTTIKHGTQDAILIEIIDHPAFQRLWGIHQYGITHYVKPDAIYNKEFDDYNRAEHSIKTMIIARLKGRPLNEQIACLLHDIVHTAFSHVSDVLFDDGYHDATENFIHFLNTTGITTILNKYRINIHNILPRAKTCLSLSSKRPDLNLDRLEYTLTGGWLLGKLKEGEVKAIVDCLKLDVPRQKWYFKVENIDDETSSDEETPYVNHAYRIIKNFANVSLELTLKNSAAIWNTIIYHYLAKALQRAMHIGLITEEDITYNMSDDQIWELLISSNDNEIYMYVYRLKKHQNCYHEITSSSAPPKTPIIKIKSKFRTITPLLKTDMGFTYLKSDSFKQRFLEASTKLTRIGYSVTFHHKLNEIFTSEQEQQNHILYGC